MDALDLQLHLLAQLAVESAQGLVHEEHGGLKDERAGQGHALLLPAAELVNPTGSEGPELDHLEGRLDPTVGIASVDVPHSEREGHVVEHGHVGEERVALEDDAEVPAVGGDGQDRLPVQEDVAGGRVDEPGHHHERRRLPGAARAEQRDELARRDGQVHGADGRDLAIVPAQPHEPHLGAVAALHRPSRHRLGSASPSNQLERREGQDGDRDEHR